MANTKNAEKAMRQSRKRRERNRLHGRTTRNAVKKLRLSSDKSEATKMLPEVVSLVDKLAKQGVIHKKKADNLKSGLMKKINNLK
jgi:small subunit ribosomal protein S20